METPTPTFLLPHTMEQTCSSTKTTCPNTECNSTSLTTIPTYQMTQSGLFQPSGPQEPINTSLGVDTFWSETDATDTWLQHSASSRLEPVFESNQYTGKWSVSQPTYKSTKAKEENEIHQRFGSFTYPSLANQPTSMRESIMEPSSNTNSEMREALCSIPISANVPISGEMSGLTNGQELHSDEWLSFWNMPQVHMAGANQEELLQAIDTPHHQYPLHTQSHQHYHHQPHLSTIGQPHLPMMTTWANSSIGQELMSRQPYQTTVVTSPIPAPEWTETAMTTAIEDSDPILATSKITWTTTSSPITLIQEPSSNGHTIPMTMGTSRQSLSGDQGLSQKKEQWKQDHLHLTTSPSHTTEPLSLK